VPHDRRHGPDMYLPVATSAEDLIKFVVARMRTDLHLNSSDPLPDHAKVPSRRLIELQVHSGPSDSNDHIYLSLDFMCLFVFLIQPGSFSFTLVFATTAKLVRCVAVHWPIRCPPPCPGSR
jgi:hypothetical protein